MATELDKDAVAKAYARWAPVYDLVFGAVFERGRKASIAAAERIGGRILEVGVGTGLSLPDYSWTNRLVGVDLSVPMLHKAKARVAEHRLTNIDGLVVMDAQRLGFQDAAFDVMLSGDDGRPSNSPNATSGGTVCSALEGACCSQAVFCWAPASFKPTHRRRRRFEFPATTGSLSPRTARRSSTWPIPPGECFI